MTSKQSPPETDRFDASFGKFYLPIIVMSVAFTIAMPFIDRLNVLDFLVPLLIPVWVIRYLAYRKMKAA